jgi:hypothetical protein
VPAERTVVEAPKESQGDLGDLFFKSSVVAVVFLFILVPASLALALGASEQTTLLVASLITAFFSVYVLIFEGSLGFASRPATVMRQFAVDLGLGIRSLYLKTVHPARLRTH